MRRLLHLLLVSALVPAVVAAQSWIPATPVDSGTEVRVTLMEGHERVIGRLTARYARTDAELRLCAGYRFCIASNDSSGARRIATENLLRFEVRRGDQGSKGFMVGAVTGAALIGLFAGGLHSGFCESSDCGSALGPIVKGALIGGVSFGFIGGLIGTLFPKWGPSP